MQTTCLASLAHAAEKLVRPSSILRVDCVPSIRVLKSREMVLYLVGIGLADEKDITVR